MSKRTNAETVDVWLLPLSPGCTDMLTDNMLKRLFSAAELSRFQHFKVASKKEEFIASRLLLRYILSSSGVCRDFLPEDVSAVPDEMGRPYFYHGSEKLDYYFSLSHTKGFIICAAGHVEQLGCDVELIQKRKYERELNTRVFSKSELKYYSSLSHSERRPFFYKVWTLKEAYVKSVGQGLRIPLSSLSFADTIENKSGSTLSFFQNKKVSDKVPETAPSFFYSFSPTVGYIAAVACACQSPLINFTEVFLMDGAIQPVNKK